MSKNISGRAPLQTLMASVAAATALLFAAAPAEAQFGFGAPSFVFVGETAGDDVSLLLGEISLSGENLGFQPVVSLQSYLVDFPGGSTWSIAPAVGVRYRAPGGFLQGKVNYSWKDEDTPFAFFGGSDSGFGTSAHAEFWGDGSFGLQGLASYGFASEYFWSRARGTARVYNGTAGSILAGAELTWQGETEDDPLVENNDITQYGPVLQWVSNGPWIVVVGGGVKQDDFLEDDTWYAKAELVFQP